eukprot:TRINITY_DN11240_c0_g2_i1.p1 TRINITY_DN11240_c0_g2~~TRINITY_DN11240_c0_g2_i1.p1  ORF type:complete len:278 (-),score=39.33 TRINITY_DN11240_c0_g2_i1:11-745(-)
MVLVLKKTAEAETDCADATSMAMRRGEEAAKRFWTSVRMAAFMLRRDGSLRMRKLVLEFHLFSKLLRKSLVNLYLNLHQQLKTLSEKDLYGGVAGLGMEDYEFSCTTSPATPFLLHIMAAGHSQSGGNKKAKKKSKTNYFSLASCMQAQAEEEERSSNAIVASHPDLNLCAESFCESQEDIGEEAFQEPEKKHEGFAEEKTEKEDDDGVDKKAEKFICKFYEQIRLQRQISFIRFDEMLARGAS